MLNKYNLLIIILIGLLIIIIGFNFLNFNSEISKKQIQENEPTYKSFNTKTSVYNKNGEKEYQLTSYYMQYFSNIQTTLLSKPIIKIFNKTKRVDWIIFANNAKLLRNTILYLNGNIKIINLTDNATIKKIFAESININLNTYDISSDQKVIIYGTMFNAVGTKMRGNLYNKKTKLIEKSTLTFNLNDIKTKC